MADKIVKIYGDARFLPRHDTLENWQTKNPILLEAEPSYVIDGEDGKKIKFGDGVTPWNDLPYLSSNINNGGDITVDQTYAPTSENAQSGKAVAEAVSDKQDSLVSGTNIKTINNQSILGSGNITIEGGSGSSITIDQTFDPDSENAQSGKAVKEALTTLGDTPETVIEKGNGDYSIRQKQWGTLADGEHSISLGRGTKTYNKDGVSLGRELTNYSHVGTVIGYKCIAGLEKYKDGQWSSGDKAVGCVAIGWENKATHQYANVFGDHNNSSKNNQTVFGKYCADNANALLIVGNGKNNDNRSNVHTVEEDGTVWYNGDVYVGSSSGTNRDEGSKKLATEEYADNAVKDKISDVKIGETSIVKDCIAHIPLFGNMNIDVNTYSEAGEIAVEPNTIYILSSANNDNKCGFFRTNKFDENDVTSMSHRIVMLIAGQIIEDIVENTTKHKLHCYHVGASKGTLSMNYDFYGADYVVEWYNLKLTYPAGATVTVIKNKSII